MLVTIIDISKDITTGEETTREVQVEVAENGDVTGNIPEE